MNGNVITPISDSLQKIFPARRRFPARSEEVAEQNHARQKVGASRFHIELNQKEQAYRERVITTRAEQQKQTTSVLGFGRADLPTEGVVDNFRRVGYGENDLISKPKLKPPPPGLAAARVGNLQLHDGSGFGLKSAGLSASRLSSDRPAQGPPSPQRRANRSNQTSSALADAFKYDHVDSWQTRSKVKVDPFSMKPAGSNAAVPPAIFSPAPTNL